MTLTELVRAFLDAMERGGKLDAELRRLTQPTAERLANEILGPGTFKQIQDVA